MLSNVICASRLWLALCIPAFIYNNKVYAFFVVK